MRSVRATHLLPGVLAVCFATAHVAEATKRPALGPNPPVHAGVSFDRGAGDERATVPTLTHRSQDTFDKPADRWVADRWVLVRNDEPVITSNQDGSIAIEGEHFTAQRNDDVRRWYRLSQDGELPELAGAGDPTRWVRSDDAAANSASGRQFVRILPDTRKTHADKLIRGENFSPEPGKLAVLDYQVRFPAAGRYYVWARAFSTGTEDNGLHVGMDGTWPESGQRMQWCDGKGKWTWNCAQRTDANHCGEAMQIWLDVETPGMHTVSVCMREDGFALDKLFLTRDIQRRPEGEGPPMRMSSQKDASRSPDAEPETADGPADQASTATETGPAPNLFPKKRWVRVTPEQVGVRPEELAVALEYLQSQCFDDRLRQTVLVRNGQIFFEGDNVTRSHNIYSCTKSFTSTALGLLIADGRCQTDSLARDFEPVMEDLYSQVSLRHFATMTSGYSGRGRSRWDDENSDWSWTPYEPEPPHFAPGTAYAYWDEAQMMYGRVLTRIAGEPLLDLLQRRIFDPIGMGPVRWGTEGDVDGIPIHNGCTGIEVNALQLARFGHLMLHRGRWKDRQLVPAEFVRMATRTQVDADLPIGDTDRANVLGSGSYGFNWWTSGGLSAMPDAPQDAFYASGLKHNVLAVVPSLGLVVVRMGTDGNPTAGKHHVYNRFLQLLAAAMEATS